MMKGMREAIFLSTFIRFACVGVVNTAVGALVMFLLYNFTSAGYWFSSAMNYVVGSILSYILNKYFTFSQKGQSWAEIFRFIAAIAMSYLVAYGFALHIIGWVLADWSEISRGNVSMALGAILYTLLNYFAQKYYVFTGLRRSASDGAAEAGE